MSHTHTQERKEYAKVLDPAVQLARRAPQPREASLFLVLDTIVFVLGPREHILKENFVYTEATRMIAASTSIFCNSLIKIAITITSPNSFEIMEWYFNLLSSTQDDQHLELISQNCNFNYSTQLLSVKGAQKVLRTFWRSFWNRRKPHFLCRLRFLLPFGL